jgi:hypothetical protein
VWLAHPLSQLPEDIFLPYPLEQNKSLKGTQDWDFFSSNLKFVLFLCQLCQHIKILQKNFLIGPFWGEVRFFRVVLGLRGIKIVFNLGQNIFVFNIIYDPFLFAKNSFSKTRSINWVRDGFQCPFVWKTPYKVYGSSRDSLVTLIEQSSCAELSLPQDLDFIVFSSC